jgi:hypothetical protein
LLFQLWAPSVSTVSTRSIRSFSFALLFVTQSTIALT